MGLVVHEIGVKIVFKLEKSFEKLVLTFYRFLENGRTPRMFYSIDVFADVSQNNSCLPCARLSTKRSYYNGVRFKISKEISATFVWL